MTIVISGSAPAPAHLPVIFKLYAPRYRKKVAIYDYDHTLVQPKNHRQFSKDIDDWEFTYPEVPSVLKAVYEKGYMICICTQQSKAWKLEQIKKVLEPLNIPMWVSIATDKSIYKPNTVLFDTVIGAHAWDPAKSLFVGDALGRRGDWSDCDKLFAMALKVSYTSPEEYFKGPVQNQQVRVRVRVYPPETRAQHEVVIMTGYPGSGKSTYVDQVYGSNTQYSILHGDIYKTPAKMIKAAKAQITLGKSVVIDSTNPSKKQRGVYIDLAKAHNLPATCVHMSTSYEDSYENNKQRPAEKQVPRIVYNVYKKHFEIPTEDEGCVVVSV